jgi:hypothetical protein
MVSVVKSEWHQVEKRYGIEIDADMLTEIYPELDEDEIAAKLAALESGEEDVEEILNEAWNNDVDIEWDHLNEDDWWTDRKGGYDITYKVEEWEVREDYVSPITHKCTNCKWTGSQYDAQWSWVDKEGNELDEAVKICPMCDNGLELTEVGVEEAAKDAANKAKWAKAKEEADEEEDEDLFEDTPERTQELNQALEELKAEFDRLIVEEGEELSEESDKHEEHVAAKWPFEEELDKEMEEELKGLVDALDALDAEMPGDILPKYPAGEYTIRIWGRTREIGVGKISKQQYEYWSHEDHEDDLSDAMNESYDYDENDTPKKARFDAPYYEYQDVHSFWGFDEDDTHMTITNENGEEIYEGTLDGFIGEAHGDNDSRWEATEEVEELYPEYLGKGYFVMWTQGGKGSCIQTTIDTNGEEFDPRKLKYTTWDVQGSSIVNRLSYDGDELDDDGMDSEHDNWRGQWSQFDVYHNKK